MRFSLVLLALLLPALPAPARFSTPPRWYWTAIDADELALWRDGWQVGNYRLDTDTYYPRAAPGVWSAPEDPPVNLPEQYQARRAANKRDWRTNGVTGAAGASKSSIPDTGLHLRVPVKPPATLPMPARNTNTVAPPAPAPRTETRHFAAPPAVARGAAEVPAFQRMPALTFVAKDGAAADAALKTFRGSSELAKWREKYGARAKAYSYADFAATSSAFKLDEDKQYAASGFVALVQAAPPDANDKAVVKSIYEFASPAQFAGSLRDADPSYDPNPPDAPALSADWQPWHVGAAAGLGIVALALAGSAVAVRRRQPA